MDSREIHIPQKEVDRWVQAVCGYCSTGCGLEVGVRDGRAVTVRGDSDHPVNQGKLCLKGIWEFEAVHAPNRALYPLMREDLQTPLRRVPWEASLDRVASEFRRIQERHGPDALAVVSTGQITTEEFYTLGKLVRGGLGTNRYDGNTTLCMASAVSGYKRSFGSDGPPGCYDDFDDTECLLAFGSNLVECHPVIYYRLKAALERRHFPVVVVDPRVTTFAQMADVHLPIRPGTDVVLLNALAHVILKEGWEDKSFLQDHTEGFEGFRKEVDRWTPEAASRVTGISPERIEEVARLYGRAGAAMSIWTMGINQSVYGSDGVVAINNLALITGNVGKPGGTSLSITGQCNAMGTREFSSCSGLPGYRQLENPDHRREIARFWGVDDGIFPAGRGPAMTDIFREMEEGKVKALWLIATNPVVSMPDTPRIRRALEQLEFLVVQDVFYPLESAEYAHVVLPAAMWAEKTGTFTNTERRVSLMRKAVDPPGEARSDLEIFINVGEKVGLGKLLKSRTPEAVFDEIREVSRGRLCDYSGLDYGLLEKGRGVQWPVTPKAPAGSARLYTDGRFAFGDGKARLIPLPFEEKNETPDPAYPFWLNTGRVIEHWHTRTKTGRIGNLNKFSPVPYLEMNPADGEALGIGSMEAARVASRRGSIEVLIQLTGRVAPGQVFLPFHFAEGANLLTLGLLDPYSRQPAYKQCAVKVEKIR